ncbi:MAG: hypothetical protein ACLU38_16070 [Dysosmobacter sp.]
MPLPRACWTSSSAPARAACPWLWPPATPITPPYGDAFGGKALACNPDYGLVSEPSTYGESLSVAAVSNGVVNSPYVTVGGK